MANVDQTERLMISSISHPELAFDNAKSIADLPDENKPVAFRGKDQNQVLSIPRDLRTLMLKTFKVETLKFSSNNNNLSGWDLYETLLGFHVEIKLGSATDAALGMSHVESLFGPEAVRLFPSVEERLSWRKDYVNNPLHQRSLYINKLSSTAKGLNALTPINTPITNTNTIHSLNMLYANINQQKLMDNIADATLTMPQVYRFSLNKKGVWKQDIRPALTSDNTWVFNGAEVSDRGRLSMKFSNGVYTIRIVYNQKNSYSNKELGIVKAPGVHGLGTPSMNVWVRKITKPKPPVVSMISSANDNSKKLPSDRIK